MTRERKLKCGSVGSVGSAQLLPAIRELYWKLAESYLHEPWELVHVLLYSLNCTDDLADEAEITAAVEVAGVLAAMEGSMSSPLGWNPYLARSYSIYISDIGLFSCV